MPQRVTIGIGLLALLATSASAQTGRPASPTALIEKFSTSDDAVGRARAFTALKDALQQKGRDVPRAFLDSIGDALSAIAIAPVRGDRTNAIDALTILELGSSSSARRPYSGAFEQLRKVHANAGDIGVRSVALRVMTRIADNRPALPYLEAIAVSKESETMVELSLQLLASKFGDAGRKVLARIDEQGSVQWPMLKRDLRASKASGYRYKGGVIY